MADIPDENWYIVKQASQQCKISSAAELETLSQTAASLEQQWGPFKTQNQALAKRVGLIRAGKCQPT